MESGVSSWSRPGVRPTNHEGLFRVEEQAGNTVRLKRSLHFFGKSETTISHGLTGPFVN